MKKGNPVSVRTPRGAIKTGKFVREVQTAFGPWYEITPTDDTGKAIRGAEPFRARPASVTAA